MTDPKRHLGYHDRDAMKALPVQKGDHVRIPKGATVKQVGKPAKPAGRAYTVLIHHLLSGRSQAMGEYRRDSTGKLTAVMVPIENPKVCWAGNGGYWCEADINDVELVKP